MADDDKSMRKGMGYSHKNYVVGNYKDLLESLRAEDPNYHRKEDNPPVEAETVPVVPESIPPETGIAPVEMETDPVVAENILAETRSAPVEAEHTLFLAEAVLAEAKNATAEADNVLSEAKTATNETENTTSEVTKIPVVEKDDSLIEANNLVTSDIPPEKQGTPSSETEQSPAESLIAANELLAAIALVLEREQLPSKDKESSVEEKELTVENKELTAVAEEISIVAEEISAAVEEFSSDPPKPPTDMPVPEATAAATAVTASVAEQSPLRGISSDEDDFPKRRRWRKDMVYFDLTMVFLLMAISVSLFFLPDMDSFSVFFWVSCLIFSMSASYNMGLLKGLIISILPTLGYGAYLLYKIMVDMTISEITLAHIAWFVFLPLGSFLTGKLSDSISVYIAAGYGENRDN